MTIIKKEINACWGLCFTCNYMLGKCVCLKAQIESNFTQLTVSQLAFYIRLFLRWKWKKLSLNLWNVFPETFLYYDTTSKIKVKYKEQSWVSDTYSLRMKIFFWMQSAKMWIILPLSFAMRVKKGVTMFYFIPHLFIREMRCTNIIHFVLFSFFLSLKSNDPFCWWNAWSVITKCVIVLAK